MLRAEIGPLQGADRFKCSEYAHNTVIFAGVGDGVDVGTRPNRRQIGVSSLPAGKGIAYGVGSQRQASLAAFGAKPRARFEVGRSKDHAGNDGRRGCGDLGELVDFRLQSLLIDFEIHVRGRRGARDGGSNPYRSDISQVFSRSHRTIAGTMGPSR